MADDPHHGAVIIIRKKGGGGRGHHGGAWKIAFADFMTAMMAFFLVLWIINASDKDTKTVIARYFNPVKLENPAKAKKGVHGETTAPTEGKEEEIDKADKDGKPAKDKPSRRAAPPADPKAEKQKPAPEDKTAPTEAGTQASEAQLFSQPYQALDRIAAGQSNAAPSAAAQKGEADPQPLAGALSIESFRDPFKPIGPGSPDDPVAFDADQRSQTPTDLDPAKDDPDDKTHGRPAPSPTASPRPQDKPAAGAPPHGPADAPAQAPAAGAKPAEGPKTAEGGKAAEGQKAGEGAKGAAEQASGDKPDAARLEKELKQKVEATLKSGGGPDIEAHMTKEGLLISLTDKLDFSMFTVGSAEPRPELVRAMEAIAKVVKATPGRIVVRGHTDARPYRNGAYDNWRLSSDRAQMAYYMLTRGGAPAARFVRVEGYADRSLRDPAHPLSAVNRRLEILIEGAAP
jgi:chemotaxis protein MotB